MQGTKIKSQATDIQRYSFPDYAEVYPYNFPEKRLMIVPTCLHRDNMLLSSCRPPPTIEMMAKYFSFVKFGHLK